MFAVIPQRQPPVSMLLSLLPTTISMSFKHGYSIRNNAGTRGDVTTAMLLTSNNETVHDLYSAPNITKKKDMGG